jgi:DtxR family Mn-dependent transcriptional regulator
VLIREAQDDSPDRLRRWRALGLVPGATVTLLRHQPLDGVFEVEAGGRVVSLAAEGLAGLLGEPARTKGDAGPRRRRPTA